MLRSIRKQSGESVESVRRRKGIKATVGRICRKGRFYAIVWNENVRVWWTMRAVSRWNRWKSGLSGGAWRPRSRPDHQQHCVCNVKD